MRRQRQKKMQNDDEPLTLVAECTYKRNCIDVKNCSASAAAIHVAGNKTRKYGHGNAWQIIWNVDLFFLHILPSLHVITKPYTGMKHLDSKLFVQTQWKEINVQLLSSFLPGKFSRLSSSIIRCLIS